eukprot:Gregarina_sp_Poly_1__3296@NODE_1947_length_3020_cov_149_768710_g1253_i0_p1_GENE_NODE_1947_length_3020_cov_149_768710_g1253_i0NODE_1947_length_3020_cov_149_768710_g1253_i0_p1_ORF_typecomplete_len701_score105_89B56/PF01603_20/2_1e161Peroxin3/PF04882_12/0_38Peroxin3/PF04882_12/19_NODE_1947_length_3020_cov_149_768710_g1253_i07372839
MMGLLSSVKRRMSRETSNLQPSNERFTSATGNPMDHASSAPAAVLRQHQGGSVSARCQYDADENLNALPLEPCASDLSNAKSNRLLISGLVRPAGVSSEVSPRSASALMADHLAAHGVPTLTPVAGGDTPLSFEPTAHKQQSLDKRSGSASSRQMNVFPPDFTSAKPSNAKVGATTRCSQPSSSVTDAAPGSKSSKTAKSSENKSISGSQPSKSSNGSHRSSSRSPTSQDSLWLKPKESPPLGLLVARQGPSIFAKLPSLKETPNGELLDVFKKKLRACGDVVFDWRPAAADTFPEEREAKRATLQELMEIISSSRAGFIDQIVEDLIQMVSANIFRPLPPSVASLSTLVLNDPEELEPVLELSWPHLTVVYEILLRFVMSNEVNPKTAKKYIDHSFVLRLLDLFASEDPRERDYLKTIMHRVYGKIMALRAFIRKAIQHVFSRYIYENDSQHGVSELLEILGSIINGFAQPLKEEHKSFLQKSMIPLHKSRHLISYHQQLTYCMTQYIDKDGKLVEPIVNGLLRYWPVTNTPKEVLFLNEVEEILEITPLPEFQKIMEPLFKQMALCIQSQHFQVSERVLFLWNNARIVRLINQNKNVLFPIVISALYKNTKEHWNTTVHGLTFNVCKLLAEADPHLFDQCNDENVAKEKRRDKERESRRAVWHALEKNYALKKTASEGGNNQEDITRNSPLKFCDDGP